jgi:hypothetical protein
MVVTRFNLEIVFLFSRILPCQAGTAFFPYFLSSVCRERGCARNFFQKRNETEAMEEAAE